MYCHITGTNILFKHPVELVPLMKGLCALHSKTTTCFLRQVGNSEYVSKFRTTWQTRHG